MKDKKVIIWGLPLHSHTHSYIHDCFYQAFKHMGYSTQWVTDTRVEYDKSSLDNSIVITCGVDCTTLPVNESAFYVLHNIDDEKYKQHENWMKLQVYTRDAELEERNTEKLATFTYWQKDERCLYQPWATDLLPHEMIYEPVPAPEVNKVINWIGSVTDGMQGNLHQLQAYAQQVNNTLGINVGVSRGLSREASITALRASRHAPTIVGQWQCDYRYVPCRMFKNISYGQPTFSNSEVIKEISGEAFFEADCAKLAIKTEDYLKNRNFDLEKQIIDTVRNEHTYINRCQRILDVVEDLKH